MNSNDHHTYLINIWLKLINNRMFIPVTLVLLIQLFVTLGVFIRVEYKLYDSFYRLTGIHNPGNVIVIIALDDDSIEQIGPLPWSRTIYAQLLEQLSQAKVVTFDLTVSAKKDYAEDMAFAKAIEKNDNVVLPFKWNYSTNEKGEYEQIFDLPADLFLEHCREIGFVNMSTDIDQVVRRSTLVDINYADGEFPIPSLNVATYLVANNLTSRNLKLIPGYLVIGDEKSILQKIPIDSHCRAIPFFRGPKETFETISYADVLYGKIKPDYFKDKIVYIGSNTQEEHDVYATPYTTSNHGNHGLVLT